MEFRKKTLERWILSAVERDLAAQSSSKMRDELEGGKGVTGEARSDARARELRGVLWPVRNPR